MKDFQELTRCVCEVARQAGAYIKEERASFSVEKVERKHAHDYVSYVDKGSEERIVKALRQLLPEAGFITEDFAPYAVSIALINGSEILVGVVYDICADECFYAWKDGGAWMNGTPIHVGNSPIADALICLQLPYNSDAYKPFITRLIAHFYGNVGSIRMMGSAAMALCYVAAGRLDAYAERYIGQWDFMAGALIVLEAGGCVTNYAGSSHFLTGDSIIATNAVVHQYLLEGIKGAEW